VVVATFSNGMPPEQTRQVLDPASQALELAEARYDLGL
jgi:hypothetical protein